MDITVYGAGYVGLVAAVCFAKIGHRVCCLDNDKERVTLLQQGKAPIYEKDLNLFLTEQLEAGRLFFTHDLNEAIGFSTIHFIAVGTPSLTDGSADLSSILDIIESIAYITTKSCCIVIKSTVPIGTGDRITNTIATHLARQSKTHIIAVGSNPEFLREGCAIDDFLNADRIIVGGEEDIQELAQKIYEPLTNQGIPLMFMDRCSAELTKYAANTFLACKISFINKIGEISASYGANIDHIAQGIGLDHRIGSHFFQAGLGYGGSCFPKDLQALIHTSELIGIDSSFIEAIESINQQQKKWMIKQLKQVFNEELKGLRIGIWGLAFKPGTDDIREASSLPIIEELTHAGAELVVFDPQAITNAKKSLENHTNIFWVNDRDEVFDHALDALLLITEWEEFKQYPLIQLKAKLGATPLFDGRNCFDLEEMKTLQLNYYSVGRPPVLAASAPYIVNGDRAECAF